MDKYFKDIRYKFEFVFIGKGEVLYTDGIIQKGIKNDDLYVFRNNYGKIIMTAKVADIVKWGGITENKYFKNIDKISKK